jgi:circadian clock protein KaiC
MSEGSGLVGKANLGVSGLDDITSGGLTRGRLFLLEGSPGTGKTTIATQFLRAGAALGERSLYITLSETEDELRMGAESHGWTLDGVDIFELVPPESLLDEEQQQSLLYSSDLELGETTRRIFEAFERIKPERVVLDSLSEIRLLAQSSLRYRRQILALKHYFAHRRRHRADARRSFERGQDRSMQRRARRDPARGAVARIRLRTATHARRQISRAALSRRLSRFRDRTGGVRVFPRLVSSEHKTEFKRDVLIDTASAALNALLGGGVERGSSVLILGPAGTGKSLLVLTFIASAVLRGEHAAMFVFDEELGCCSNAPRASASICRRWSTASADHRAGRRRPADPGRAFREGAPLRRGAMAPRPS